MSKRRLCSLLQGCAACTGCMDRPRSRVNIAVIRVPTLLLRGAIMVSSRRRDHFTETDERFAESATRWVSLLVHRAELVEDIQRNALEQGRKAAAEEIVTLLSHDLRNRGRRMP